MGRAAAEVMKRLGATEVNCIFASNPLGTDFVTNVIPTTIIAATILQITSRLYVVIYTFINIWKDPLQGEH